MELHVSQLAFANMQKAAVEADLHGNDASVAAWKASGVSDPYPLSLFDQPYVVKVVADLRDDQASELRPR